MVEFTHKDGISQEETAEGRRARTATRSPRRANRGEGVSKKDQEGEAVKEKKIQSEESHRSQEGSGFSRGVYSRHGPSWTLLPSRIAGNLLPLDAEIL